MFNWCLIDAIFNWHDRYSENGKYTFIINIDSLCFSCILSRFFFSITKKESICYSISMILKAIENLFVIRKLIQVEFNKTETKRREWVFIVRLKAAWRHIKIGNTRGNCVKNTASKYTRNFQLDGKLKNVYIASYI